MDRGAWQATVHGVTRVRHNQVTERTYRHQVTSATKKQKE